MFILCAGKPFRVAGFFALAAIFATGCGSKSLTPPKFDPETIAQQAMDEYDTNKDGKLDQMELEKCPALRHALLQIAGPEKNYIDQEDLVKRLEKFQKS